MSMHPKDGRMHGWWALFGWLAVLAALVWLVRFALQHFGLLALALALALPLAAQHGIPQPHDKGLGVAALDQGHGKDGSPAGGWNVREIPTQSRLGLLDSYRWSQIALAGVTALDIASSYGLRETNPLVGSGRFNGGMARKTAIVTGAGMLAQEWAVRRYPKMRPWVAKMNFGIAGARGFVATWNWTR